MKAMDSIIGYTAIKHELKQISDTLKNSEFYDKLGVTAPRGLLLYGNPGVGKTLMATAIIEESGRVAFTCRKDKPNGDFIKHIKSTFDKAAESVPSIVYLDDMDKFTNGDARHPDAEEYVTVQSCIDSVKDKNVFVLATVNNIQNLPPSLRRAGRFDRIINIEAPRGKDAEMMKGKRVLIVDDVIPALRNSLRARFARSKNTAQTRSAIRSQVIVELENKKNAEYIDSYGDVSVTALESDPIVCVVEFGFAVAHGLNRIYLSAHITV